MLTAVPAVAVPPPPGVSPDRLAPVETGDDRARQTYTAVLAEFAARADDRGVEINRIEFEAPTRANQFAALRRFAHARIAADRNEHNRAVGLLEEAIELDPTSPVLLRELAHESFSQQRKAAALNAYERLLAIDPTDAEAGYMVGGALIERGENDAGAVIIARAREHAEALEADPALPMLMDHLLTRAWFDLGYLAAAAEAAERSLEIPVPFAAPTLFRTQLSTLLHHAADVHMLIGDVYARLGQYHDALDRYHMRGNIRGERGPGRPEPATLLPRIMYVHLQMNDPHRAAGVLAEMLPAPPQKLSPRDAELVEYLAAQTASHDDRIVDVIRAHYEAAPGDARAARAAAALLPAWEAQQLLRNFLAAHPDNAAAAIDLLRPAFATDPVAAVQMGVELTGGDPLRYDEAARRLIAAADRPTRLLEAARRLPPAPQAAMIEAYIFSAMNGHARAWRVIENARASWPDDPGLRIAQLRIAALLDDSTLVRDTITSLGAFDDPGMQLAADCEALTALAATALDDAATTRLGSLILDHGDEREARHAAARAALVLAGRATGSDRRKFSDAAIRHAEEMLAVDPTDDDAFAVLLEAYQIGAPASDVNLYRTTITRLRDQAPESRILGRFIARQAAQRGNVDRAIDMLRRMVEADPSDRESTDLLMLMWQQARRLDRAQAWIDDQRVRRPGDPILLGQAVSIALAENRAEAAARMVQQTLDAEPEHSTALQLLAHVRFQQQRGSEAVKLIESTWRERPQTPRLILDEAATRMQAGQHDHALELLRANAERLLALPTPYALSVFALLQQLPDDDPRRESMAGELAAIMIAQNPEVPLTVYAAALHAEADNPQRVKALAREAADLMARRNEAPQFEVQRYRELTQLLIDAGHPGAAAVALRTRAKQIHADRGDLRIALSRLSFLADAVVGDVDASLDTLHDLRADGVLSLPNGQPERDVFVALLYATSATYLFVGDDAGSARLLRAILSVDPDNTTALNDLGYRLLIGSDDPQRSIPMIERVEAIEPAPSPALLDTIGWLRYKQGRYADDERGRGAKSIISASIASEMSPGDVQPEVMDHAGDVAWRLGEHDAAERWWRSALDRLTQPGHRERESEAYRRQQLQNWGVVVVPGEDVYDRNFAALQERLEAKIDAIERGVEPPIAPIFSELSE